MGFRREQGIRAEQEREHTRIAVLLQLFPQVPTLFLVRQLHRGRFASVQFGKAIKGSKNIFKEPISAPTRNGSLDQPDPGPFLRADLGAAALAPLPILRASAK